MKCGEPPLELILQWRVLSASYFAYIIFIFRTFLSVEYPSILRIDKWMTRGSNSAINHENALFLSPRLRHAQKT